MAFHDDRLPEDIARGYKGGPGFKTAIVTLLSGYEQRNITRAKARQRFSPQYPLSFTQAAIVRAFFYARRGAGHSFRHKDWMDYKLGDTLTDTYQTIGTGDGVETNFQIFKRYSSGGIDYDRTLDKIVAGTTRVWVDGVEQVAGWTVGLLTGIVNFSVAPSGSPAPVISVLCEFDTAVRFDTDDFPGDMLQMDIEAVGVIPLIEVFGE